MVKCSICGKELYMPFSCKYCGKQFCSEHRLPENHKCDRMELIEAEKARLTQERVEEQYLTPQPQVVPFQADRPPDLPENAEIVEERYDPETGETMIRYYIPNVTRPEKPILGLTSGIEIKHLTVGIFLMFESVFLMFLLSFLMSSPSALTTYSNLWILLIILGALITVGFIGHELSHKFASIFLNYWAEFRLTPVYTVLTALIPYFVMPGAVQVSSSKISEEDMGKIAVAGPLFNLVLGVIYAGLGIFMKMTVSTPFTENGTWWIFGFSAFMNCLLGLFNLLPVYVLDGRKIITWSKGAWVFALISLFGLGIILMFLPWGPVGAILGNPPTSLYR
ncbi:MAG: AN1-type zinc finger domain-containing protein [Candidatus Helarchaeota archaeon]